MRLKRKYPAQLAQRIYDSYLKDFADTRFPNPLVSALLLLRRDDELVSKLYQYASVHLEPTWPKTIRDIDYVRGFLKAIDAITPESLAELNLSSHEQMMILEENTPSK